MRGLSSVRELGKSWAWLRLGRGVFVLALILALPLVTLMLVCGAAVAQTVTIDPETGDFIDSVPTVSQPAVERRVPGSSVLSTYHEDLVAVPSSVTGSGMIVDLRGRFQQVMKATIGPDGTPAVHCDPAAGEGN